MLSTVRNTERRQSLPLASQGCTREKHLNYIDKIIRKKGLPQVFFIFLKGDQDYSTEMFERAIKGLQSKVTT